MFFTFRARLLCKKKRFRHTFCKKTTLQFEANRTLLTAFASENIYTDGSVQGFFGARPAGPVFAQNVRPTPVSPPSGDTWNPLKFLAPPAPTVCYPSYFTITHSCAQSVPPTLPLNLCPNLPLNLCPNLPLNLCFPQPMNPCFSTTEPLVPYP